jgi:hypothetical protein
MLSPGSAALLTADRQIFNLRAISTVENIQIDGGVGLGIENEKKRRLRGVDVGMGSCPP